MVEGAGVFGLVKDMRSWGRFAVEIRDSWKKTRVWLGKSDSSEEMTRA